MDDVFIDFSKHVHQTFEVRDYIHNFNNSPNIILSCTVDKGNISMLDDVLLWKPLKRRKDNLNFQVTIQNTVVKGFGKFSRFEVLSPDYNGGVRVKITFTPIEYSVTHYENAIRNEKINKLTNGS